MIIKHWRERLLCLEIKPRRTHWAVAAANKQRDYWNLCCAGIHDRREPRGQMLVHQSKFHLIYYINRQEYNLEYNVIRNATKSSRFQYAHIDVLHNLAASFNLLSIIKTSQPLPTELFMWLSQQQTTKMNNLVWNSSVGLPENDGGRQTAPRRRLLQQTLWQNNYLLKFVSKQLQWHAAIKDYLECKLKTTNFLSRSLPLFASCPPNSSVLKSRQFLLCNREAPRQDTDTSAPSKHTDHSLNCVFLRGPWPSSTGMRKLRESQSQLQRVFILANNKL